MNPSSKQLVIDTATKYIYLALIIDGKLVEDVWQEGTDNHSVTIMPLMETMFKHHQCELKDMNAIYIGIGPGSYTGVRIGVAIAKMIGYLNHVPLYSFSTLALLASGSESQNILAYIDARRGNAFLSTFQQKDNRLNVVQSDCLIDFNTFCQSLSDDYDKISEKHPKFMKLIESGLFQAVKDVHELTPNYLQITEAERNRIQE